MADKNKMAENQEGRNSSELYIKMDYTTILDYIMDTC